MNKEIGLVANYTLTACSDIVLKEVMKITGRNTPEEALRVYKGILTKNMRVRQGHNLVPLILRRSLATLISGTSVTPTFKANHLAMGSDSTAPNENNTQLGTETIRAEFGDRRSINNVAFLDKNFGSAEVGGNTYNEIGVFVDGTGSAPTYDANSGYLISRILINETMAVTESLTINVTFTING